MSREPDVEADRKNGRGEEKINAARASAATAECSLVAVGTKRWQQSVLEESGQSSDAGSTTHSGLTRMVVVEVDVRR